MRAAKKSGEKMICQLSEKWIINPREDAEKQLKTIRHLVERADTIVNAGDPDREGQLLVDEILDDMGCTKWSCVTGVMRTIR
ncbi:toprim domain-containing protein [Enterobacter kobei]|uniref:toprim domain-containing protein n=1 Tax=Enterobacter kobei TaxID=208224 RepID=UPI003890D053